ncbi:MAG: hypothetical protein GXW99_06215 [Clostridiales bacterium]|nr:hypothetical protein [Clostridiales bacterium]
MNINGQAIKHKTFGCGVVTDSTADTVTVCFPVGEKKFIYPDAFGAYLELRDTKMQRQITTLIARKEAETSRQRLVEQKEQEHRQRLLNFTIAPNSHAAFHVAPEQTTEICRTYTVSTGRYLSGYSKGEPRIAERMKPNSVCLFTECPRKIEKERRIIGACMVQEDFFGEDARDGWIQGHPDYRLSVPAGSTMPFWQYFEQTTVHRWGSMAFKYCSGTVMNRILADMVALCADTKQEESAIAFYRYFCRMNRLRPLVELEEEAEA